MSLIKTPHELALDQTPSHEGLEISLITSDNGHGLSKSHLQPALCLKPQPQMRQRMDAGRVHQVFDPSLVPTWLFLSALTSMCLFPCLLLSE